MLSLCNVNACNSIAFAVYAVLLPEEGSLNLAEQNLTLVHAVLCKPLAHELQLSTFLMLGWLQEEDNFTLAAQNQQMKEEIAELEARIAAAEAAAAADSPPATPASEQWVDGVQARAAMALQRAADTRRLSGMFEVRRGRKGCLTVKESGALCHAMQSGNCWLLYRMCCAVACKQLEDAGLLQRRKSGFPHR
jgi:hypothetical protein